MNTGSGERDEHHLTREIAGRMAHRLVGGGDPAARGVVVNSKVDALAATFGGFHQRLERNFAALVDDRLRSFDHRLDAKSAVR